MATLAETMFQAALQSSAPENFNNTTQAFASGAAIAQHAQQLQQQQQEMDMKKQQLQEAKMDKFATAVEKGQQYSGKAQSNYYNKFLPQYKTSLGLDNVISNDAIQFNGADEGMIRRQGHLVSLVNQGKMNMAEAIATYHDPQKMVSLFPGDPAVLESQPLDKPFADELNKAEQHRQQNDAQMQKANTFNVRNETAKDTQNMTAVEKVHNDSTLVGMVSQRNSIQKGKGLLVPGKDGALPSWKAAAEVLQDYSTALNPKGGGSDFKLKEFQSPSAAERMAEFQSYISSNPDQPMSPGMYKWLNDFGNRLDTTYAGQIKTRAKVVGSSVANSMVHNNPAKKNVENAVQSYVDDSYMGGEPKVTVFGQSITKSQALDFFAKHPEFAAEKKKAGL